MAPRVPSGPENDVIWSKTLINPVKEFVTVIIASEFAKFCTKAVKAFPNLFRLPSQLLALFSPFYSMRFATPHQLLIVI